jgi:hypothetical protein
MEGEMTLSD